MEKKKKRTILLASVLILFCLCCVASTLGLGIWGISYFVGKIEPKEEIEIFKSTSPDGSWEIYVWSEEGFMFSSGYTYICAEHFDGYPKKKLIKLWIENDGLPPEPQEFSVEWLDNDVAELTVVNPPPIDPEYYQKFEYLNQPAVFEINSDDNVTVIEEGSIWHELY